MKFVRMVKSAPDVVKADGTNLGMMPARAMKYCEPLVTASRQGWYVYPPVDFYLMWTGSEVLYKLGADGEWTLLDRLYLTDFVEDYQKLCPEGLEDYYPPFLDVFPEGDIIQIGTGYSLIGDEGQCHWVRGPINLPSNAGYDCFEAMIDSSWFCSPLFINVKLRKQDVPISFPRHRPLLQVLQLPNTILPKTPIVQPEITEMDSTSEEFWQAWARSYDKRNGGRSGSYASEQRRINAQYADAD